MATISFLPISVGPTWEPRKTAQARVLKTEFGDGYGQRVSDGLNPVRDTWSATWENLSIAEATLLDDFLRLLGGAIPFLWIPPGATVAKKFTCETWDRIKVDPAADTISCTFVEVFDL